MMKTPPIYADYQASTPIAPEAIDAMMPYLTTQFGNPHSMHAMGRTAMAAVALAQERVAALLPKGGRVVFTSGATEAINWALKGAIQAQATQAHQGRIAVSAIEHAAVLDCADYLATQGARVQRLPVNADGLVDLATLPALLDDRLDIMAVMQVNNEIGTIQPIAVLAELAHARGGLLLCDAVQGFGRLAIDEGPDCIAISAHKIHGPKGIGALWVRDGVTLTPLIHGGGQQQGMRSGTLAPALCAGFGVAAMLAAQRMAEDDAHIRRLSAGLMSTLGPSWVLNGGADHRWAGNINVHRAGLDVARLLSEVRGVMFSAGSACASGSGRPSHVLQAIGMDAARIRSSIRLGIGRYTTMDEMTQVAALLNAGCAAQGL